MPTVGTFNCLHGQHGHSDQSAITQQSTMHCVATPFSHSRRPFSNLCYSSCTVGLDQMNYFCPSCDPFIGTVLVLPWTILVGSNHCVLGTAQKSCSFEDALAQLCICVIFHSQKVTQISFFSASITSTLRTDCLLAAQYISTSATGAINNRRYSRHLLVILMCYDWQGM